jgi:hypothetical protein
VLLPTKTGYAVVSVEVTGFIVIFEAVSEVMDVIAVVALPLKLPVKEVAVTLPVIDKVELSNVRFEDPTNVSESLNVAT